MTWSSYGFFVLRRPIMPMEVLFDINNIACPDEANTKLLALFNCPLLKEALFLASPTMHATLLLVQNERKASEREKFLLSLYKYLVRMSTRCTPYGIFAGITHGQFAQNTAIRFSERDRHQLHSRLDAECLNRIVTTLAAQPAIAKQIHYSPNTSLYKIGSVHRFLAYSVTEGTKKYNLLALEYCPYLNAVLSEARLGGTVETLRSIPQLELLGAEEATGYIRSLIDAQVLVSELEPAISGQEFLDTLIEKLSGWKNCNIWVRRLRKINQHLKDTKLGVQRYKKVQFLLQKHFSLHLQHNISQTDLYINAERLQISQKTIDTLNREFQEIRFLGKSTRKDEKLTSFISAFQEKYGACEVPLPEITDPDTGIQWGTAQTYFGDSSALLGNISFPLESTDEVIQESSLLQLKEQLFHQAVRQRATSITIKDTDIEKVINTGHFPDHFHLMGSLITSSAQELDQGKFKFIYESSGGVSGMELFGRFCHLNSALETDVKRAIALQNTEAVIYAEIVHLPQPRLGNILKRPHLSAYEIPFLCNSTLPDNFTIRPDDLLLSIRNGNEIILRSKKLNKRVIPRLTTAYNSKNALPLYKVLVLAAGQHNGSHFQWDWDYLGRNAFLPRIEYKHWVISRAQWNITPATFQAVRGTNAEIEAEFHSFCHQYQVPRLVQIVNEDHELLIDILSHYSLRILVDTIRKKGKVTIREFLHQPGSGLLKTENNHYTNQIIVPFYNAAGRSKASTLPKLHAPRAQRYFLTGQKWLYCKIYTGKYMTDRLMTTTIRDFCKEMVTSDLIEKWFFVRYEDPRPHLRLRFYHGKRKDFWEEILRRLSVLVIPLILEKTILQFQTETYERELERYSPVNYDHIETIFFSDSEAVVDLLSILSNIQDDSYRWLIALRGTTQLLEDLGFDLQDKRLLVDKLRTDFFIEFHGDANLTKTMDILYRTEKFRIKSFMNPEHDAMNQMTSVQHILNRRSDRIAKALDLSSARLQASMTTLATSLVHMFLNRLFCSNHRAQELIIYHFLNKYYQSEMKYFSKLNSV